MVGVVIEIVCWLSSIVSIKRKAIWRQGWGLRDDGGGGGGGVGIHCEHCDQLPNIKQKLFLLHFPITIQYKSIVDCDSLDWSLQWFPHSQILHFNHDSFLGLTDLLLNHIYITFVVSHCYLLVFATEKWSIYGEKVN